MATDSQGRPLSDDGQWAWNGTEWVPANDLGLNPESQVTPAQTPSTPAAPAASDEPDAGATMIAPSPFASGAPGQGQNAPGASPGYGSAPTTAQGSSQPAYGSPAGQGGAPGYGSAPAPGYGDAPGYGGGTAGYGAAASPAGGGYGGSPGGFGAPSAPPKSKKPIILAIIGVLVVVAVVLVLVLVVFKSDDKSSTATRPGGKYDCKVASTDKGGSITFKDDGQYDVSGENAKSGRYAVDAGKVTFTGGSFNGADGAYDADAKTVKITFSGVVINCKQ